MADNLTEYIKDWNDFQEEIRSKKQDIDSELNRIDILNKAFNKLKNVINKKCNDLYNIQEQINDDFLQKISEFRVRNELLREHYDQILNEENLNGPLNIQEYNNYIKSINYTDSYDHNLTNDECPICLEKFILNSELHKTSCNHHYHPKCLKNYLTKLCLTPICPMCRKNIK